MKNLTIILTVIIMAFSGGLVAQDLNAAGEAYNDGIGFAKENQLMEAIESYQDCADICKELGEVGEGLKVKAETQISSIYLKLGIDAYKAKTFDTAISLFELSADYANIIGKPGSVAKANNYIAVCHAAGGNALIKEKKYADAIGKFKTSLEYNPQFFKAYYGMAICYSKTDSTEALESSVKKVIELGEEDKTVQKAENLAAKYFLKLSGNAIQKENYREASMMAKRSIEYNYLEPTAFYYQALSNNYMGNFDEAITAVQLGIKAKPEDESNLQFELGRAYEGKADNTKACEAYAKVVSGPNVDAAAYQRTTVLGCN